MSITRIGSYSEIKGSSYKIPCKVATTGDITLSGTQTIDGIPVVAEDRVLVKNQNTASQNGIYIVASGSWSRAIDMSLDDDTYEGVQVFINTGSTNAETSFFIDTTDPIVLNTTNVSFKSSTATGTIIDVIFLTGGTTYTPTVGTKKIFIQMVGGGGGGGGAAVAAYASASGGGAGGYLETWVTNISSSINYSYIIASGGTGGPNSTTNVLNTGSSGGTTTFTTNVTSNPSSRTFTCTGGGGGEGSIAGKTGKFGGAGGAATNGDMNAGGAPGGFAFSRAGTEGNNTGFGGSGPFGGGGVGISSTSLTVNEPGFDGRGYGAGGGGAYAATGTGAVGGDGAPGLIKITEYT